MAEMHPPHIPHQTVARPAVACQPQPMPKSTRHNASPFGPRTLFGAGLATLPLLLSAPAQADPAALISGGFLLTGGLGTHPASGIGFEVSVPIFPDGHKAAGLGPLYQMTWVGDDRAKRMIGIEFIQTIAGLELGWSDRLYKGESLQGIHVAPFLGVGVGSVALRTVVPTHGQAWEVGLALTLKLPLPVAGETHFLSFGGHGRPLREAGRPVRAPVLLGARRAMARGLAPGDRQALAAAWLEDALEEHASVANFERLALMLAAHGAPAALVQAARRAAADEADHAERCFEVAGALLGRHLVAAPIAVPQGAPDDLRTLAVDGLKEGELGEQVAADCAEIAADSAAGPVQVHLRTIARDEARHAWLSGTVRRWAEGVGGDVVRRAVAAARNDLPHATPPRPEPEGDRARRWGRLPAAQHAEVFARVRARLPA